jgi:hypothetical protein
MTVNINEIIGALHSMDEADVRRINQAAYAILKQKRSRLNREAKNNMHVGATVTFRNKWGITETGTIKKVNRTRCVVDTGQYQQWTVPMTQLTVV